MHVFISLSADGQLTDLASFYTLPSSVIGHDRHDEIRAAFQYYTVQVPPDIQLTTIQSTPTIADLSIGLDAYDCPLRVGILTFGAI